MSDNRALQTHSPDGIQEVDVRATPRGQRHRQIFDAYHQLPTGQSMILINDHEPHQLRDEFDRDFAGSFGWESEQGEGVSRVRITKRAGTPLPRIVADTCALTSAEGPEAVGSIWHLEPAHRDLDSNVIALPPGGEIGRHDGPDLDVLILILSGSGTLETELDTLSLRRGQLIWLPRAARRSFAAGDQGIRYLTVHHRKPTLNITAAGTTRSDRS